MHLFVPLLYKKSSWFSFVLVYFSQKPLVFSEKYFIIVTTIRRYTPSGYGKLLVLGSTLCFKPLFNSLVNCFSYSGSCKHFNKLLFLRHYSCCICSCYCYHHHYHLSGACPFCNGRRFDCYHYQCRFTYSPNIRPFPHPEIPKWHALSLRF